MSQSVTIAIKELKKGRPVIIVDDNNRENEGDLVVAAEVATPYAINFISKHSSGVICLATTEEQLNRLKLPQVSSPNHTKDPLATPFSVSCEASKNISTGISAFDRAESIKVIGNPKSTPSDIVVPGHIFPLQAHSLGLRGRKGHTEASVELCKLAKLWPAAAIAEIPSENGGMMKGKDLDIFAKTYNIPLVSIKEIEEVIKQEHTTVFKTAESKLPTSFGIFNISIWESTVDTCEGHIVLTMGEIKGAENVPLRIHSQCLTGDVFYSKKCDCGEQLQAALKHISEKGKGILIWLRQEGRGIGLTNKIKAYYLQDTLNLDTIEANLRLNLPVDARRFDEAIEIINYFAPQSIELLTNNPQKLEEVKAAWNNKVVRKELLGKQHKENVNYLKIKQTKCTNKT